MRDLTDVFAAIDQANNEDPNRFGDAPLAQYQGIRASHWLAQLVPDPSDELQVAVRAHHLRRWELERGSYPEGRSGYLQWRRDNKAHQGACAAVILTAASWDGTAIERVRQLLTRTRLRTDPEVQALEDAACLVFVETQFETTAERLDHEHMVSVVAKTLKKMSDPAIALAAQQPLSQASQLVLADAIVTLGADSA